MWYLPTNCPRKLTQFHCNALTDGIYCLYNPPMTATSGFRHSPGPPPLGDVLDIVPADCQGQRNGRQVWCFFVNFFCMATPQSAGAIQREYLPDDSVQWLQVKPWTPYIGRYWRCCAGASSRASKRVGRRCICSSLTILSST